MSLKSLTLENLPLLLNGKIAVAFNQAVRRVHADLNDRPALKKARKIKLVCEIGPNVDLDNGLLLGGDVQFYVEDSIPNRQTAPITMKATASGLMFEPESPDDPDQTVLSDLEVDKETGEVMDE